MLTLLLLHFRTFFLLSVYLLTVYCYFLSASLPHLYCLVERGCGESLRAALVERDAAYRGHVAFREVDELQRLQVDSAHRAVVVIAMVWW
jgi:hypothetical protein